MQERLEVLVVELETVLVEELHPLQVGQEMCLRLVHLKEIQEDQEKLIQTIMEAVAQVEEEQVLLAQVVKFQALIQKMEDQEDQVYQIILQVQV
tara:strand:- start:214 stop:495 length:282 start_codon:yes stop_codon:yes gene_type:complete